MNELLSCQEYLRAQTSALRSALRGALQRLGGVSEFALSSSASKKRST